MRKIRGCAQILNEYNKDMTNETAQRNIEGILRILPEVDRLAKEAKESGNERHQVAQEGHARSLRRQLEIYRKAIK
jgi:hypothetical protein